MYDKIEIALKNHPNFFYTNSSRGTYNKYPYDEQYTYMYTDFNLGAHRDLNPLRIGDWGTATIICSYKKYLKKYVTENARILDFGTGVGWPAYWIEDRNYSIVGVDGSDKMIELAEDARLKFQNSKVEFICANGETLPFEDNTFDAIVMDRVLEFTQNPEVVIKELSRILKKDGVLIAGITNWENAFGRAWGGFVDGKRVLYPKREAKIIKLSDNNVLKYRCCSLGPPEERTYYITFDSPQNIERLVDVINGDYVDVALKVIEKLNIKKIEAVICKQFTPQTHKAFFETTNFEVLNVHGIRKAVNNSASYFIKQLVKRDMLTSQLFEEMVHGLAKVIEFADYKKDIDMFTIAINRKDE